VLLLLLLFTFTPGSARCEASAVSVLAFELVHFEPFVYSAAEANADLQ
jgi:hypothetical protein